QDREHVGRRRHGGAGVLHADSNSGHGNPRHQRVHDPFRRDHGGHCRHQDRVGQRHHQRRRQGEKEKAWQSPGVDLRPSAQKWTELSIVWQSHGEDPGERQDDAVRSRHYRRAYTGAERDLQCGAGIELHRADHAEPTDSQRDGAGTEMTPSEFGTITVPSFADAGNVTMTVGTDIAVGDATTLANLKAGMYFVMTGDKTRYQCLTTPDVSFNFRMAQAAGATQTKRAWAITQPADDDTLALVFSQDD